MQLHRERDVSHFDTSPASGPAILVAGHVVIDQIIDERGQRFPRTTLGGPISYSSLTLTSLGQKCEIVTKVGFDFPSIYESFLQQQARVDVSEFRVPSYRTTSYRIDRTFNPRRMWLLFKCRSLAWDDFAKYLGDGVPKPKTLIVNSVANEISLSLMERLSKEFELVLADSQGFVRKIPKDHSEIRFKSGLDISSLSGVDVLKADTEELASWTGVRDRETSIRLISKFVDVLLLTSGAGVVDLFQNGKHRYRAFPFQVKVGDTTGAGDIMLASFASKFTETREHQESLIYAVSAASLAVKKIGVEKAVLDPREVEDSRGLVKVTAF